MDSSSPSFGCTVCNTTVLTCPSRSDLGTQGVTFSFTPRWWMAPSCMLCRKPLSSANTFSKISVSEQSSVSLSIKGSSLSPRKVTFSPNCAFSQASCCLWKWLLSNAVPGILKGMRSLLQHSSSLLSVSAASQEGTEKTSHFEGTSTSFDPHSWFLFESPLTASTPCPISFGVTSLLAGTHARPTSSYCNVDLGVTRCLPCHVLGSGAPHPPQ
mmetsp:Transcript_9463/g.57744  ORF Transcript_9463/g.57744 Transcript_9463/m.57744 type:complete len:213 (-) Transcript_9463:280-918(-)